MEFKKTYIMLHYFIFSALIIFSLTFSSNDAYSMESLGLDKKPYEDVDELSECGQKISEFKFFLRDGKKCIRDTDCTTISANCPLGCTFYVNKNFVTILENRIIEVDKACTGSVCSARCRDNYPKPTCTPKGRCVADY